MQSTPTQPTQVDIKRLTSEEKDALIEKLLRRVQELEAIVMKTSRNSSKPPSSDGLRKTSSLRGKSDKRPGGQAGHVGHSLRQSAQVDRVIEHKLPPQCDACGQRLEEGDVLERRQVIDIPVVRAEVTEYWVRATVCRCGKEHSSAFAAWVSGPVQYGPNLRTQATYLTQAQLLPYQRTVQLFEALYGISVSTGTLARWDKQAGLALAATVQTIAAQIGQSAQVHADESGLRVGGKLQWLHTACTEELTWYGVHPKRGSQAIQAHGVIANYQGTLSHDCWAPYWSIECRHALCNAHLLRELTYAHENTKQGWAQRMIALLLDANAQCEQARASNRVLTAEQIGAIDRRYRRLIKQGQALNPAAVKPAGQRGRAKQSVTYNLLKRLDEREDEVLLFVRDLNVPFTNNLAERAIRGPKIKQKISGSFRSESGAQTFCVIRSFIDTTIKQGQRVFDALRQSLWPDPPLAAAPA